MKAACVLVIRYGAGCGAATTLKDTLQAAIPRRYVVKQLILPCSLSEEDGIGALTLAIHGEQPRILIFCPRGNSISGEVSSLLVLLRRKRWDLPVVIVLDREQPDELIEIMKLGVSDFITLPLRKEELEARLWAVDPGTTDDHSLVAPSSGKRGIGEIVGGNPAFLSVLKELPKIANCDASVLLNGETGTGKEMVARAIHYLSARSAKPFVPVNCGAIPVELVENEFFGHEAGAFTSANTARRGVVKEAEGGTLFLDEIDSLPPTAQVKLLRFLQDGYFRPLGSERICQGNVRLIAASNTDFEEALKSGRFRKDLYYRLNVLSVTLPPLRERPDDVLLLARHFLQVYVKKFDAPARDFAPASRIKLGCYDWPGNVRELENVVERAVVLADHALIQPRDIRIQGSSRSASIGAFNEMKAVAVEQFEKNYLRQALAAHDGNITKAAESARKARRAFWELLRKHRLTLPKPSSSSSDSTGSASPRI